MWTGIQNGDLSFLTLQYASVKEPGIVLSIDWKILQVHLYRKLHRFIKRLCPPGPQKWGKTPKSRAMASPEQKISQQTERIGRFPEIRALSIMKIGKQSTNSAASISTNAPRKSKRRKIFRDQKKANPSDLLFESGDCFILYLETYERFNRNEWIPLKLNSYEYICRFANRRRIQIDEFDPRPRQNRLWNLWKQSWFFVWVIFKIFKKYAISLLLMFLFDLAEMQRGKGHWLLLLFARQESQSQLPTSH